MKYNLIFNLLLFLCLYFVLLGQLFSQTVEISGPTTVCPNNFNPNGELGHDYTAQAVISGSNATCTYWQWFIIRQSDNFQIDGGAGNTISDYNFTEPGDYIVRFFGNSCGFINVFNVSGDLHVTSRVKMPNKIKAVTSPSICIPGQTYTFETDPPLGLDDETCYYHYEYYWTAPQGWSINGGSNSFFGFGASANIIAPSNTPPGNYTISVQATIPNGQPGPFPNNRYLSDPRNYSVRVGDIDSSQIYVSGTSAVCNGNTHTYTAIVPGGHQAGYSYDWYFPSGWSLQSSNVNTITLYVPTYNTSYGPVRFSVDIGCGPTGYSGITTFPCNYSLGSFMVYPNPSIDELNIELIEDQNLNKNQEHGKETKEDARIFQDFKVVLYDEDQKMVKEGVSNQSKIKLETNNLKSGTYYLYIFLENKIFTKQIIIYN